MGVFCGQPKRRSWEGALVWWGPERTCFLAGTELYEERGFGHQDVVEDGGDGVLDSFAVCSFFFGQQAPISELADLGAVQGHADADEALLTASAEAWVRRVTGAGNCFCTGEHAIAGCGRRERDGRPGRARRASGPQFSQRLARAQTVERRRVNRPRPCRDDPARAPIQWWGFRTTHHVYRAPNAPRTPFRLSLAAPTANS